MKKVFYLLIFTITIVTTTTQAQTFDWCTNCLSHNLQKPGISEAETSYEDKNALQKFLRDAFLPVSYVRLQRTEKWFAENKAEFMALNRAQWLSTMKKIDELTGGEITELAGGGPLTIANTTTSAIFDRISRAYISFNLDTIPLSGISSDLTSVKWCAKKIVSGETYLHFIYTAKNGRRYVGPAVCCFNHSTKSIINGLNNGKAKLVGIVEDKETKIVSDSDNGVTKKTKVTRTTNGDGDVYLNVDVDVKATGGNVTGSGNSYNTNGASGAQVPARLSNGLSATPNLGYINGVAVVGQNSNFWILEDGYHQDKSFYHITHTPQLYQPQNPWAGLFGGNYAVYQYGNDMYACAGNSMGGNFSDYNNRNYNWFQIYSDGTYSQMDMNFGNGIGISITKQGTLLGGFNNGSFCPGTNPYWQYLPRYSSVGSYYTWREQPNIFRSVTPRPIIKNTPVVRGGPVYNGSGQNTPRGGPVYNGSGQNTPRGGPVYNGYGGR